MHDNSKAYYSELQSATLQATYAAGLLKKREEAVCKLEEFLSEASQLVGNMEKKVLTLKRQKQKEVVEVHKILEQCKDAEQRMKEEVKQTQVIMLMFVSSQIPKSAMTSPSSETMASMASDFGVLHKGECYALQCIPLLMQ